MGSASRGREALRKKQKEMIEIKNTVTELENDFDELFTRHNTAEEIISELEHVSVKTLQTKRQSETMVKRKKNRISEKFGMISKGLVYTELKY